jgi:hypothetical protein
MPTDVVKVKTLFAPVEHRHGVIWFDMILDRKIGIDLDASEVITAVSFQRGDQGEFLASLCQAAQRTQQPIMITWKDSRYGRQIVSAAWETEPGAAA